MSSIEPTMCRFIKTELPVSDLLLTAVKWRDADSTVIRKIATSMSLAVTGLAHLIDAIASLTSPAYFAGSKIPESFLDRSKFCGNLGVLSLTIAQYHNIVEKNLFQSLFFRLLFT